MEIEIEKKKKIYGDRRKEIGIEMITGNIQLILDYIKYLDKAFLNFRYLILTIPFPSS